MTISKKSGIPKVGLIGRMNVGKSTLFNRLTDSKKAITSSLEGTTRDAKSGTVLWRGMQFEVVDTGGLDVQDDEQLEERVIAAARRTIKEVDLVLFIIDGQSGVLPQDKILAEEIRAIHNKPVFLVVNKIDTQKKEFELPSDVYQLNINPLYQVSAGNGRGSGDLLDAIFEVLKNRVQDPALDERTKVAIVGRPNVGKSSLLNAILGEERVIVADKAHTTRDTNDIRYSYKDRPFMLIDTAGIRKQANVGKRWGDKRLGEIEKQSVDAAIAAMQRADVVLLVLEAQLRITAQDKKIAQLADEHGKGLILVLNKWDMIPEKDSATINQFTKYFDAVLPFLKWAPMIFTSATEQLRVREVLDLVVQVTENYERELTLEELEPILFKVKGNYKPRISATRKYRKPIVEFKRLKQIGTKPPRFYVKATRHKDVPQAIPNIIERELRYRFKFDGVKIIIEVGK